MHQSPEDVVLRLFDGIDTAGQPCDLPRVHEARKGADHGGDGREEFDHTPSVIRRPATRQTPRMNLAVRNRILKMKRQRCGGHAIAPLDKVPPGGQARRYLQARRDMAAPAPNFAFALYSRTDTDVRTGTGG